MRIHTRLAWIAFAVTVVAHYPGIRYPITVDVTPRRVQRLGVDPGQRVSVRVGDAAPTNLTADAQGLLMVRNVAIRDAEGTRIHVTKSPEVGTVCIRPLTARASCCCGCKRRRDT